MLSGQPRVTVTWTNEATNASGTATSVADDILGAGVANHRWSADIPLTPGSNALRVSARDPSGNNGLDTVTVMSTVPAR